jgi:hypothetical protein
LSERSSHKFEFTASQIASAAAAEAEYHTERVAYWRGREKMALAVVESTIGAKVVKHEVTGGNVYATDVTFDRTAWTELQLAEGKAKSHREAADQYRTEAAVYGTQGGRPYDLDPSDVHHFRLGGQSRED